MVPSDDEQVHPVGHAQQRRGRTARGEHRLHAHVGVALRVAAESLGQPAPVVLGGRAVGLPRRVHDVERKTVRGGVLVREVEHSRGVLGERDADQDALPDDAGVEVRDDNHRAAGAPRQPGTHLAGRDGAAQAASA
jgi:hypothetical protein